MPTPQDQHRDAYRDEALEYLSELEDSLLALEERPEDMDIVGRVFRAMHTIKGSGAMFGYDDIAAFTHNIETVYDLVRGGRMKVSRELVNLTLGARDHIRVLLDADRGAISEGDAAIGRTILEGLRTLMPDDQKPEAALETGPAAQGPAASGMHTYRIRFKPAASIFMQGSNPVYLLNDLRALGECRVVVHMTDVPALDEIEPEGCFAWWDVILTTDTGIGAIRDVFIFVADDSEVRIDLIDDVAEDEEVMRLGEILVARGDITRERLEEMLKRQRPIGALLVDEGIVPESAIASALEEQKAVKEIRKERRKEETASTIRVPSSKLDTLVDLVGELVTVQASLTQTALGRDDDVLRAIAEEVERLTADLHDNTMSIRMVQIGSTFSKFRRLVRDLSAQLGKDIQLTTEGAETELDKTVIERLNDPLVHLIRNSIDHGVEMPDERAAAGKPPQGTIHLSARHSGANVLIEIVDDGAGIDPAVIRAKGVEKGLVQPDAALSEKETFALIFMPGFSTASKVTDVSGRGVGMDVVKRGIDALRGRIDVTSRRGLGTTITLRLPLTLAIIDGLLVEVGGGRFVIALGAVEECVELSRSDIASAHGRHTVNVRGEVVPYIRMREHFIIDGPQPDIEQVVIGRVEDQRVGFAVDKVIGQHQTVIKTLGRMYRDINGISGATILGDGTVALILDLPALYAAAETVESASRID